MQTHVPAAPHACLLRGAIAGEVAQHQRATLAHHSIDLLRDFSFVAHLADGKQLEVQAVVEGHIYILHFPQCLQSFLEALNVLRNLRQILGDGAVLLVFQVLEGFLLDEMDHIDEPPREDALHLRRAARCREARDAEGRQWAGLVEREACDLVPEVLGVLHSNDFLLLCAGGSAMSPFCCVQPLPEASANLRLIMVDVHYPLATFGLARHGAMDLVHT
mmetsp:Transcript_43374/g.68764  ORF Transcript_43374/g.68764 Transcript_43374/m.68764 type:complete len:218 (-) Transcript_43374:2095-2748(-)